MSQAALLRKRHGNVLARHPLLRTPPSQDAGNHPDGLLLLGFCIGANSAIFSLINALVLRPLPVADPGRLVSVAKVGPSVRDQRGREGISLPMLRELDRGQRVFTGIAAWGSGLANFEVNGVLYAGGVTAVDGSFFPVLGVRPLLGRLLTASDVGTPVAVLDYRCWRVRYNGDPNVVGKTILVNARPLVIIGVTPERFGGLEIDAAPEAIVPVGFSGSRAYLDPNNPWDIIARLKPGVRLDQARSQLQVLRRDVLAASLPPGLSAAERQRFLALRFEVESAATGISFLRPRFLRPIQIVTTLVGLVLLIACANIANLMLARSAARRRELGIRVALGARPARLLSQLLTESLLLSGAGAVVGLLFACWAPRVLLNALWTGHVPSTLDTTPDLSVLGYTALLAAATGVLVGLAPAWKARRADPAELFEGSARTVRGSGGRMARVLLTGQMALSLVLVVGATLFTRSILSLYAVDPGYRSDRVLALQLFPQPGRAKIPDRAAYYRQLAEEMHRLPGVESVGYCNLGPATAYEYRQPISVPGSAQASVKVVADRAGPGFFGMIGMHVLAGREFTWLDDQKAPRVAVISESLARQLFPGRNPIGARIDVETEPDSKGLEIVGVVNSASLWTPKSRAPLAIYTPLMQSPNTNQFSVYLLTSGDPLAVTAAARQALVSLGYHYALRTETLEQRLDSSLRSERIVALLAAFLGAMALLLASMGLYGVMAYTVTRRTPEIGVRVALGASRRQVSRLVLRDVLSMVASGLAVGIPASIMASRLLSAKFFEIPGPDFASIASAAAILSVAAVGAGWLPARRAARLDPMAALRSE